MTCFGMIAAVSLEALFLPQSFPIPQDGKSGFPFAKWRRLVGLRIWGRMHFTMCLCFGMCVISFLLCGHEIYVARCQKCLWIASTACREENIKLRAASAPENTWTRRGTNVTLYNDRCTMSWCSSVSSLRFASATKNPGLFAFWKLHC